MDWKKAYGKKNEGGSSGGGYGSSFVGKRDAPPSYGSSFVGKRDAPKSVPPSCLMQNRRKILRRARIYIDTLSSWQRLGST